MKRTTVPVGSGWSQCTGRLGSIVRSSTGDRPFSAHAAVKIRPMCDTSRHLASSDVSPTQRSSVSNGWYLTTELGATPHDVRLLIHATERSVLSPTDVSVWSGASPCD